MNEWDCNSLIVILVTELDFKLDWELHLQLH